MARRSRLLRPGRVARTTRLRRSRTAGAAAVLALLALLLAACSGGAGSTSSDAGGGSAGGDVAALDSGTAERAADGSGGVQQAGQPEQAAPLARQVIRTGEATLQADDVTALREEVGRLVQRYGGHVSSERSFNDQRGRLVEDRLVLRVPSERFDQLLADFAEVAVVLDPRTEEDDVTTEVIDVDSRVRTAEVSLDRLRSFLRRSTDVDALIRLESEMAEREADLASLRAQQDYLEDQTSLATLTLTLQRTPEDEPAGQSGEGFLAGLAGGWTALRGVVVVAATLLGAAVPFALAAAVIGVPVVLVLRALRRRRPPTATAAPPAAAPGG